MSITPKSISRWPNYLNRLKSSCASGKEQLHFYSLLSVISGIPKSIDIFILDHKTILNLLKDYKNGPKQCKM